MLYSNLPIKSCLCVSVFSVYLKLKHLCLCVGVHDAVFEGARVRLSLGAIWSQSVVVLFSPPSSQMAICKTRPSVGPLPRFTALPCTTPLPHLSSLSPLRITRFTSFPHFSSFPFSLLSFPYLLCTLHSWLSVSLCLFISLHRSLYLSFALPHSCDFFLLRYLCLCPSLVLHSH